jgi:hypothetical protein
MFAKIIECGFEPSIVRQGWLTITDIGVVETSNHQSLQGFSPLLGPMTRSFYTRPNRKTKTHERVP